MRTRRPPTRRVAIAQRVDFTPSRPACRGAGPGRVVVLIAHGPRDFAEFQGCDRVGTRADGRARRAPWVD